MMFRAMQRVLRTGEKPGQASIDVFLLLGGFSSSEVAVITGGASSTGKATAAEFVRNGARVILADIQDDLGHDAACYTRCDVTDEAQVAAAVDLAVSRHGRLDVVFNNARVRGDLTPVPVSAMDLGNFDRVMAVNARSVVTSVKHAARVMVPRRGGSIICTASTSTVLGGVAPHSYSVSKAAIVGLVRAVASELARSGVRVNAISPNYIPTPLLMGATAELFPTMSADELVWFTEGDMNEIDWVLEAEEVAKAALYLASEEAKYVNGHNLLVDAGFTVSKEPNMPTPAW